MVADILKEKEKAEVRAKEAEAKGSGGGQVGHAFKGLCGQFGDWFAAS